MTDLEKKNYLAQLLIDDFNGYLLRAVFVFTLMLFSALMLHAGDSQMMLLFFALCVIMLIDISQYGIKKPQIWCDYKNLDSANWSRVQTAVLGPKFSSGGLWVVSFLVVLTGILTVLYAMPPTPLLGWSMVFGGILLVPYARRQVRRFKNGVTLIGARIDAINNAQQRMGKFVPTISIIYIAAMLILSITQSTILLISIPIVAYYYYVGIKTIKAADLIKAAFSA